MVLVFGFTTGFMMIKLNKKLKCNSHKSPKVKVPKIEINECKVKTKDQKKLENEMFQQAKEARSLLDKLLIEGKILFFDFSNFQLQCLHGLNFKSPR